MEEKRLALDADGNLTYCTAKPENIGKDRCTHIDHQRNDEDQIQFMNRILKQKEKQSIDITDAKKEIRLKYAKEGKGLCKLVDDEEWHVRLEVARHGYGLDKLINDEYPFVREEVAKQGYGLDELVNDEYPDVRKEAKRQLGKK